MRCGETPFDEGRMGGGGGRGGGERVVACKNSKGLFMCDDPIETVECI